jgi:hypothetical protein
VATSPAERQQILTDLATLGIRDLVEVWHRASLTDTDFAALIAAAFPEIVTGYAGVAGDLAADWYVESAPDLPYVPITSAAPNVTSLAKSTQWALGADGDIALNRMSGTLQRAVFNGARDTTLTNVEREPGSTWARHASANACEFCKMLATRGAVYSSKEAASTVGGRGKAISTNFVNGKRRRGGQAKGVRARGNQAIGGKYHDHCHCVAIEVRPGRSYQPPAYTQDWENQYLQARKNAAKGEFGAVGTKSLLAAWRQLDK